MAGFNFGNETNDVEVKAPPIAGTSGFNFGDEVTAETRKNNEPEANAYNIDFDASRTKSDLKKGSEAEEIRDYMVQRFGEDYRRDGTIDNDDMVEDFFNHMRYVNTNTFWTAGEARYVHNADEAAKVKMGNAYKLYDSVGNVFVNDGLMGAFDGVKDYIFSAALDPSNYLGFLTGGIAKGASMGVGAGSRALIQKAISEASKRAITNGATQKAASKAGQKAGEKLIKDLSEKGYTDKFLKQSPLVKRLKAEAADREKEIFLSAAERRAKAKIVAEAREKGASKVKITAKGDLSKAKKGKSLLSPEELEKLNVGDALLGGGIKKSIYQTMALDGVVGAMHDYHIQNNILLPIHAQEEYSAYQTAFGSLAGVVGGGFQFLGRKGKGISGYGEFRLNAVEAVERLEATAKTESILKAAPQKLAVQQMKISSKKWREKVEAGKKLNKKEKRVEDGTELTAVDFIKHLFLGDDGTGKTDGLAKVFADAGMKLGKRTTVSDVMTNLVQFMPTRALNSINRDLIASGIRLGDTTKAGTELSSLIAAEISKGGQVLNVMSQVRKTLDGGILRGEDILNNVTNSIVKKEAADKPTGIENLTSSKIEGAARYAQNVWRRLLVSSPRTSAINVAGFASYAALGTVSDIFNATSHLGVGILKKVIDDPSATRHFHAASVQKQMLGQKFRNLLDPFTTHDAYLGFLEQHKDVQKILRETYTGGIQRSSKSYGIDPDNPVYKIVEAVTEGANTVAGVRVQDSFTKSLMFMTELDKNLRLKHNVKLADIMTGKAVDDAMLDKDIIGRSLDVTMKSVFSKDYTTDDQLLKGVAKGVEGISNMPLIGTILPFGRFFNNVIATAYQAGPGSVIGVGKIAMSGAAKGEVTEEATDQAISYVSRGLTTVTALALASQFDKEAKEQGLPWHQRLISGNIVDFKNVFPISTFMIAGRIWNDKMNNEPINKEVYRDMWQQMAVGQFAKDVEFHNDLIRMTDNLLGENEVDSDGNIIGGNDEARQQTLDLLYKQIGNITAGATRPLDAVNRLVGYMEETDAARDIRQETGLSTFTQASTKYMDNILELFSDNLESVTGTELRVATRKGKIQGPEPLLDIIGIKMSPRRTSTEVLFGYVDKDAFSVNSRTQSAEYDRILNEFIAPLYETEARRLLNLENFHTLSPSDLRETVDKGFTKVKKNAIRQIEAGAAGMEGQVAQLKRKALQLPVNHKNKAMKLFKQKFPSFEGRISDMTHLSQLQYFINLAKNQKALLDMSTGN